MSSTEETTIGNTQSTGSIIKLDGDKEVYRLVEKQTVTTAAASSSFAKVKLKRLSDGKEIEKNFHLGQKIFTVTPTELQAEFLCSDKDDYVFYDNNLDQIRVKRDRIGDKADFLVEELWVDMSFVDDELISISLPSIVELTAVEVEGVGAGASTTGISGGPLMVTLETGAKIRVTGTIVNTGDTVKIDTVSRTVI